MGATRTVTGRGQSLRLLARVALSLSVAAVVIFSFSCSREKPSEPRTPREVNAPEYLRDTVGELVRFSGREYLPVQAYGFVTGLDGTGTKVVPPGIRQHMLDIMRKNKVEGAEEILTSPDNAVVMAGGFLPPGIGKGEYFDLEVRAIPNTETTSLEGGFLLESDLTRVAMTRGVALRGEAQALGRGSLFVWPFAGDDKAQATADPRAGRILAGGKATKARQFRLALLTPSVRTVDQIVRIINARFPGAAKGTRDAGRVDLEVPKEFQDDKTRFLDLIGSLYLRETSEARDQRIGLLLDLLQSGKDLDSAARCLEAFGPTVLPRLRPLAENASEAVRYYVGRTQADLQDPQAVHVLEPVVMDDKSDFQEQAAEALGRIRSGVGLGVLGRALNVKNARVRVAAWRAMIRLTPETYVTHNFRDKFVLSAVATKTDPFIYVSRTLKPHVAVFGDVSVKPPVLVETRRVTATVNAGSETIRLMVRRHGVELMVESPLSVRAMIAKMAAPLGLDENNTKPKGLDLTYSDVVSVLYEMSRKQALSGPILLQPLEYRIPGDRPVARPVTSGGDPE